MSKKISIILLVFTFVILSIVGCNNQKPTQNSTDKTQIEEEQQTEGPPHEGVGGGLGGGIIDTSDIKTKYLDIQYAKESDAQKLDIYIPNEGEGPFPVIVAIHGGGFKFGDKNGGDLSAMIEGVNRGYAVACVGYRKSDEAKFPAAINDVKASIRFIRENASKYNLNPKKIAAWGDSAGGNLAALAGTTGGTNELYDKNLGYDNVSDKLTCVVDWFGPINFCVMDEQNEESGIKNDPNVQVQVHNTDDSFESQYLGKNVAEAEDLCKEANPTTYITKNTPPFFIEHGTKDGNVPTQQSKDFAAALEKVIGKDKVTLVLIDGAGHGGEQFETTENLNKVYSFLDKYMIYKFFK